MNTIKVKAVCRNNKKVVAIIGSRTFEDYELLRDTMNDIRKKITISSIVSGGAKGADRLGAQYARSIDLKPIILKPLWRDANGKYDPIAGLNRNTQIIDKADYIVAFWDMKSTGTRDSINKARKSGKTVKIVDISRNTCTRTQSNQSRLDKLLIKSSYY